MSGAGRAAIACITIAAGCGRVAFDARTDAGDNNAGSDVADAPGIRAFDPLDANCLAANSGPFVELDRFTTTDAARGIWYASGYILVASAAGGLQSLSFDGTTFTEHDRITGIGWVETLWSEGNQLYVSSPGTGVTVVLLEADGRLTKLAEDRTIAVEARQGWGDGTNLYMPNGPDGLVALRLDGTSLSKVGTALPSQGWGEGDWSDGTYHYFADINAVRVLTFDGSTFTQLTQLASETGYTRVWAGRDALFASHDGGLTAFTFNGTSVTTLDTIDSNPSQSMFLWADGVHIFVSGGMSGTFAYSFDGSALQQVDVANDTGDNLQVIGDGRFIYVAGMQSQVIAYGGFECTATE